MKTRARRIARRKVHSGYCFDVVVDDVIWPNGKHLKRDLIVHGGISVILPCLDRDRIILIRQYRYGAGGLLWELPAGTIHSDETPLACAKREIEEEIGYRAKTWKRLAICYASPGFSTERIHCFAASALVKTQCRLEEDEVLEAKVFSNAEVKKMVEGRTICDAKSLLALFYFFGGTSKCR